MALLPAAERDVQQPHCGGDDGVSCGLGDSRIYTCFSPAGAAGAVVDPEAAGGGAGALEFAVGGAGAVVGGSGLGVGWGAGPAHAGI
jgi:hypothetical protein